MRNCPNPCDTCTRDKCPKNCASWKTRYLYRQRQINEHARVNGVVPGAPEYREGVDPCESCARGETCSQICKARARYWDERMALVRKGLGL